MEKNKKIIKLCYLQIAFYVVFLTSLLLHFKRGLDHRAFALLIILTLLGCASALTLTDYLKSLIRRSGFDVAGVHDKKSLEEKLLQLQNADDTLDVGVMMFDMNNLKMINDTYGHETGDRAQRCQVVALRRRHAPAQEFAAGAAFGLFERDDLDLRPAQIDAEAQHGFAAQAAAGTKGAPGVKVSSSASAAA